MLIKFVAKCFSRISKDYYKILNISKDASPN